jgi:hypothetical protein
VSVYLSDTQRGWARRIIAEVKAVKPPFYDEDHFKRAADIALMTALTESALYMYANGNNPASLRIRHDRVGWDHGSVGLFQQQVGGAVNSTANWGTTAQCMDPHYSTVKFLHALQSFRWTHYTNYNAAQKVQGSFDPTGGNYRRNEPLAVAIRKAYWASTPAAGAHPPAPKPPAGKPPTPKPPASGVIGTVRVQRGDTLSGIAKRYWQSWVTAASIAKLNHLTNPDRIYVGQVLLIG